MIHRCPHCTRQIPPEWITTQAARIHVSRRTTHAGAARKLTDVQCHDIRTSDESATTLAARYQVHVNTIYSIRSGRRRTLHNQRAIQELKRKEHTP